jgi:hypothetical protein
MFLDQCKPTVGTGDLSPDDTDLRSADLLLHAVDVGDLLSQVEATRQSAPMVPRTLNVLTYFAASVFLTPSISIKLVPGLVLRLPRW